MKCPKCGIEIKHQGPICSLCGTHLYTEDQGCFEQGGNIPVFEPPVRPPEKPEKSSGSQTVKILAVVVAAVMLLFAGVGIGVMMREQNNENQQVEVTVTPTPVPTEDPDVTAVREQLGTITLYEEPEQLYEEEVQYPITVKKGVVRKGPGTYYKKIGNVYLDDVVCAYADTVGQYGKWYLIQRDDGLIGWIHKDLVS